MKLGEAAFVRSGLVLSRKLSKMPTKYRYQLINLRSVNQDGYIETENLDIYDATEELSGEYLTHTGDVVIRLTAPYTAVLIDETTSGFVISSNFVVIRPNTSLILSEYLYWLLNTSNVKRRIYENTASNMLGAVKPRYFADFEVSPPSIDDQRKIAALNFLAHKESRLLNELAKEKERYYAYITDKIHKQMERGTCHDDKK